MVVGQDECRVFIDYFSELELDFFYCSLDYMFLGFIGLIYLANWLIYVYEDEVGDWVLANDECFDCWKFGGMIDCLGFW